MKRFFLFVLLFFCCGFFVCENPVVCHAGNFQSEMFYEFSLNGRTLSFKQSEILKKLKTTELQREIKYKNTQRESIEKLVCMGFSKKEVLNYLFPETKYLEKIISSTFDVKEENDNIKVYKNECKIKIYKGKKGKYLNSEKFYDDLFKELCKNKNKIKINLQIKEFKNKKIKDEEFEEIGVFTTSFKSSSPERKNNIKTALKQFDGILLEEGELLRFNMVTGERNEKNGYKQAKIISGGTFVSGFGGGVCQVSTTLYNACLLAGLEILEVHNHSLPVSYVEPAFDAMVNSGSSDLVVRNSTSGKVVITTSYNENDCKVKIFGKKGKYKIKRVSEKTKKIPSKVERVEKDYKKFGLEDLKINEEKRISYAKDGFYSKGYLEYYDDKGNKVKTEKIRDCKYNPTEGVVVKREN